MHGIAPSTNDRWGFQVTHASEYPTERRPGMRRIRLAEWARAQGIARITAYRMLRRGILPVPAKRSPTGRWYVLVPERQRSGWVVLYARASPGAEATHQLNDQLFALVEWANANRQRIHATITEMGDPYVSVLPRLAQLVADQRISDIVIESPAVVGESKYNLLTAALAPQGRSILLVSRRHHGNQPGRSDARTAIVTLCKTIYGPDEGMTAALRTLEFEPAA